MRSVHKVYAVFFVLFLLLIFICFHLHHVKHFVLHSLSMKSATQINLNDWCSHLKPESWYHWFPFPFISISFSLRCCMAAAFVFRMHDKGPELVREVLLERGWEEYDGGKREEEDWNLYWRGSAFHSSEYQNLLPWQRLNHHPKTVGITRKVMVLSLRVKCCVLLHVNRVSLRKFCQKNCAQFRCWSVQ